MSGVEGVRITGPLKEEHKAILTPDAVKFLALLHRSFDERRIRLLQNRVLRQQGFDAGQLPNFLPHTAHIREDKTWKCAPPAPGLRDRRVEITGPVDRKMVINALNSGAYTFMADFEDASSPTWANMIDGQVNMNLATFRKIDFKQASNNKEYKLKPVGQTATLIVRPRGWHLNEEHFLVDGRPISGSLFDFGLHFFHNAKELVRIGYGPYFYLPKMESHLEARLWNDAFNLAQDYISIPRGTIRGTVLIETITAVFEMEEILFELRDHSSGLNCGRWDYIFSFIKRQRYNKAAVLPDRANVTMTAPFMNAYVDLLIKTCHNRHVAAIGGMAATIPIKDDKARNDAAMDKVRADKLREVTKGHDGTWVAHPALVSVALEVFNKHMLGPNQYHIRRDEVNTTAVDLLNPVVEGAITRGGVQQNVEALLIYCQSWLDGLGCKAVNYSMEDAATGEVSRYLLWSWIYHGKSTSDDGQLITNQYVDQVLAEEKSKLKASRSLDIAEQFIKNDLRQKSPSEFLTTSLYPSLPLSGVESKL